MKKTIFTMLLGILTFGLVNAQTEIFNPATYTGDLGDGMEIVQIDGVSYLQVVVNGWGSTIDIPQVSNIEGTHFAATVGFGQVTPTDAKNMSVQCMDTVNLMDNWDASALVPSATNLTDAPCTDGFKNLNGAIHENMKLVHQIQFFGQSTVNWGATVGDTIWCGRIVSVDKSVLFDPATLDPATLPDGYEVVEEGGEKLLKIKLDGWNSTLDIDAFEIGSNNKAKFKVKYEAGDSGVDNASAQAFVQMMNANGALFNGTVNPAPSTLTEVITDTKTDSTVTTLQFAAQNTNGWAAITGAYIYVSKIEVYYKGNEPAVAPITTEVVLLDAAADVTIDGLYDDAYGETANVVDRVALNETGGDISETSTYGEWLACADADNFYIYIEVNDDDPIELGASTSPWMNDGVEIFMDIHNRRWKGAKRIADEQHQFRLNYGTDGPAIGDFGMSAFFGDSDTTNIEFAIVSSSTGYVVEARIPWATWYRTSGNTAADALDSVANIASGMKVAFEVSVMDADAVDGRKSILNWANDTGNDEAYNTNEYYGEITITDGTGVFDSKDKAALKVYPNPANSQLTIDMNNIANVQIYNIIGSKVLDKELNGLNTVNVSELNNGVYIIMATDSRGNVAVSKFNKE